MDGTAELQSPLHHTICDHQGTQVPERGFLLGPPEVVSLWQLLCMKRFHRQVARWLEHFPAGMPISLVQYPLCSHCYEPFHNVARGITPTR